MTVVCAWCVAEGKVGEKKRLTDLSETHPPCATHLAKERRLRLHRRNLERELMPLLRGRVFHVTTTTAFPKIMLSGAIKPNTEGEFGFTFPQSNSSYFRRIGHVSLCDLRFITDEQLYGDSNSGVPGALEKYYFLNPWPDAESPAFLFLEEICFEHLVPWSEWKQQGGWVVPYLEAGYPGAIDVRDIESALLVEIDSPADPFVQMLQRIQRTR